jgi:hypothetical protein
MKVPNSRAAAKRSPASADDRIFVHAVLLNDPVKRLNRLKLSRRVKSESGLIHFEHWDAPEAICSRRVRLVYPMPFDTAEPENPCNQCLGLLEVLRKNPNLYPSEADRVRREVEEQERKLRERARAEKRAIRFLEGRGDEPDDYDDDDEQPDLMELLKRADPDDPDSDSSHTG